MEANRKRSREFLKGTLMPFYRASKPSSAMQYSTTKVKPTLSSPSPASVGFVVHTDYVIAVPKAKVSFVVADCNSRDLVGHLEEIYSIAADESVDTKAAIYISRVQERLKLERVNSDNHSISSS